MAPLWKSLLHPHLLLLTEAFPHPHVKKKKKKRQYNVLSETSKSTIFCYFSRSVNTSTFCWGCLGNFAYFFLSGEFNVYLYAPFHYWPGLLPSTSLLTPDLSWLFCGGSWLLVIQTCLWLISVSN